MNPLNNKKLKLMLAAADDKLDDGLYTSDRYDKFLKEANPKSLDINKIVQKLLNDNKSLTMRLGKSKKEVLAREEDIRVIGDVLRSERDKWKENYEIERSKPILKKVGEWLKNDKRV